MASAYDIVTVEKKEYYRLNKNIVKAEDVPENIREMLTPANVVDENGVEIVDTKAPEAQEPTEDNLKEIKSGKAPTPVAGSEEKNDSKTEDSSDDDSEEKPDITSDDEDEDDEEDDTPTPPAAPPAPATAPGPAFRSHVPQSKPGMGFPRVNGKTVDIFDGSTPHTHTKNVGGLLVPLSAASYRSKSDGQIASRLSEMGMAPIDFTAIERANERGSAVAGNAPVGGNAGGVLMTDEESEDSA